MHAYVNCSAIDNNQAKETTQMCNDIRIDKEL